MLSAAALSEPAVAAGLSLLDSTTCRDQTVQCLCSVAQIPSPSGHEQERAAEVAARMTALGLSDVRITGEPNVVGVLPGRSARSLVFIATLDDLASVAELQRAGHTPPRKVVGQGHVKDPRWGDMDSSGERVVGPGSNCSVSTAAILAAAEALVKTYQGERTLVFAAVAQEETGMSGMKALYNELRSTADAFVDVLGDGHSVTFGALSIHWHKITALGPGAHTLRGGLPHVNQAIGRAVDRILSLPEAANTWAESDQDRDNRTRLNVAMIDSGAVFNHKPSSGWFSLDVRSMDEAVIVDIEHRVQMILSTVANETKIELQMEAQQITPGGQVDGAEESLLVKTAAQIAEHMGYSSSVSNFGSSNTNVSVAGGHLSICLGGRPGSDLRGTIDEYADVDALMRTAKQVYLLSMTLGSCGPLSPSASAGGAGNNDRARM
jgi:acetylornithine deacetylase/succinyl-diaminopimelate desuccinylase-like protein